MSGSIKRSIVLGEGPPIFYYFLGGAQGDMSNKVIFLSVTGRLVDTVSREAHDVYLRDIISVSFVTKLLHVV